MSKINFDEYCIERLNHLKGIGYPDCTKIPMELEEIKELRIGTPCYVVSQSYPVPRLMMFLGYYEKCGYGGSEGFIFCGNKGEYTYKPYNAGKTYNVFRTM
jgi:hypothetical protein